MLAKTATRGRPSIPPEESRAAATFSMRAEAEELAGIDAAAKAVGKNRTRFILDAVAESMKPPPAMTATAALLQAIGEWLKYLREAYGTDWRDPYVAEIAASGAAFLVKHFKKDGEVVAPPAVEATIAAVVQHLPAEMAERYRDPATLGLMEAGKIIGRIESQCDPTTGEPIEGSLLAALRKGGGVPRVPSRRKQGSGPA